MTNGDAGPKLIQELFGVPALDAFFGVQDDE
jgi:hypothetical protein